LARHALNQWISRGIFQVPIGATVGGVLAVQVHHEERDGIGPVADGYQMKVIVHQGVGGDLNLALFR